MTSPPWRLPRHPSSRSRAPSVWSCNGISWLPDNRNIWGIYWLDGAPAVLLMQLQHINGDPRSKAMREDSILRTNGVIHLLQRAMSYVESDQWLALRCLHDASSLLTAKAVACTPPTSGEFRRGGLTSWQVRRARAYIEENLGAKLSVDGLATALSLSRGHFSRSFRHSLGLSPMAYVARERVARAQHLLISTGEPLTEIALVCGFSDQSHFSRSFRRTVGASPGQWRRMNPAPVGVSSHV